MASSRFAYFVARFVDTASQTRVSQIAVVGSGADPDHLAVVASFAIPSTATAAAPASTRLLHDGFATFGATQLGDG